MAGRTIRMITILVLFEFNRMVDSFICRTEKPWVFTTCSSLGKVPSCVLLVTLDGSSMTTFDGLYQEFVNGFRFPSYFGYNYNALIDCLTDLAWIPSTSYLVVIERADLLLAKERNDALQGLLEILCIVGNRWSSPIELGEWWDRKGIPFHTILMFEKHRDLRGFSRRLTNTELLDLKHLDAMPRPD